jgi:hypothetical protein
VIEIEKGIPLPPAGTGSHPNRKYPLTEMKIGDSFLIQKGNQGSIRSHMTRQGRLLGRSFSVRQQTDGSFRCWRVR